MEISDLEVGNVAYVLSGRQNSFFNATVLERDETGVRVYVHAKREEQWYYNNGTADAEPDEKDGAPRATLVPADDWRVKILQTRRTFKEHHKNVQDMVNQFRKEPTVENGFELDEVVSAWRAYAALSNPHAIRADSIQEYLDLSNS